MYVHFEPVIFTFWYFFLQQTKTFSTFNYATAPVPSTLIQKYVFNFSVS
jgi:hypothetical protein